MQIIKSIPAMQLLGNSVRSKGQSIGFVPTMGALHEGHLSLLRRAKEENDFVVASIYVNPTQFGPGEDFHRYPRDVEGDADKLRAQKVDALFLPDDGEMYPRGFTTSVTVGEMAEVLCGKFRTGHFSGVATVVAKLFHTVMPHRAYFGQKDFQQTVVIKQMVRDLNFTVTIVVCPTMREADGLAMSSRNRYLTAEERKAAVMLFKALSLAEKRIRSDTVKEAKSVQQEVRELLADEPLLNVEYAAIVDAGNLQEVERIDGPVALCIAARLGRTRLIDNVIVAPQ